MVGPKTANLRGWGQAMSRCVDERLSKLLDAAERRGACLAAQSRDDRRALQARMQKGDLVSPFPLLYARKGYWDGLASRPDLRALHLVRGFAALHPDAVFAQTSAALLYGLQVTGASLGALHLATPSSAHSASSGGIMRHAIPDEEFEACPSIGGIRVTSFWRTVFDCLRTLPEREGIVVADSAARKMGVSAWRMHEQIYRRFQRHKGIDRALGVARFADGRSENGGESVARACMMSLGYELPELQVWFNDPVDNDRSYRVDYLWRDELGRPLVIGELDGHEKTGSPEMLGSKTTHRALADERRRESRLTALGVPVMRMSFREATDPAYLDRLLHAYGVPHKRGRWAWTHAMSLNMEGWAVWTHVSVPKRPLHSVLRADRSHA